MCRNTPPGHPPAARGIPFPSVYKRPGDPGHVLQRPGGFRERGARYHPGQRHCRTGHRSVLAANLLAGAGYRRVYNVWEGFVGRRVPDVSTRYLDTSGDGVISEMDQDGWRYYLNVPYSTELRPELLFQSYRDLDYR